MKLVPKFQNGNKFYYQTKNDEDNPYGDSKIWCYFR